MAGIFDKKQEVLDFILTREGRELIHKNKFKPVYYEFYDSDVIYEADNGETQNSSKERIAEGLYSKAIVSIDQINALGGTIKNDNTNLLKNPLGSYQIQNQSAPAWQISFNGAPYLTGSFSTSQKDVVRTTTAGAIVSLGTLKDVNTYEERIPQFYVNVDYKLYQYVYEIVEGPEDQETTSSITQLYFDERNKDLFLAIDEINAYEDWEPRDFEIEIFKVVENKNKTDPYTLDRLYFDEQDFESDNSVNKYFNVLFDEEARFENNFKEKNIYAEISADPEEICET